MAASLLTRTRFLLFHPRTLAQRAEAPPLNEALTRLRRVRLISESGNDCGEMSARAALEQAKAAGRDLMQVSAAGNGLAVVRIVDYAAWHSARQKSAYDARRKRKETKLQDRRESVVKHVRLSPVIDSNDVAIKMRQARQFLVMGHRVRVYMQFRKGQGRLQENAKMALIKAAEELSEVGKVQGVPEGGIGDLFKVREEEEEVVEGKRKPMEVLIMPMPRKVREMLRKEEEEVVV